VLFYLIIALFSWLWNTNPIVIPLLIGETLGFLGLGIATPILDFQVVSELQERYPVVLLQSDFKLMNKWMN
jgi:hypothetical protein